jgi:hypothetical protein
MKLIVMDLISRGVLGRMVTGRGQIGMRKKSFVGFGSRSTVARKGMSLMMVTGAMGVRMQRVRALSGQGDQRSPRSFLRMSRARRMYSQMQRTVYMLMQGAQIHTRHQMPKEGQYRKGCRNQRR